MVDIRRDKRFKDITGQRFGLLTAIEPSGKDTAGVTWLCQCECGNTVVVRGASLRSGVTKSCGCYNRESHKTHGYNGTPTYKSWCSMKERCDNRNHQAADRYSKRGITYCDRWARFENFLSDMGERPDGKTLDRIDNSRGYSKDNCRWVSPKSQALNRDTNVVIEYKGRKKILNEWAREFGLKTQTFYTRYRSGWTMEEIEKTPVLKRRTKT